MAHVTSDSRSDNIPCVFVNIEQHDMHMHTHAYADVVTREWKSLRGMIFAREILFPYCWWTFSCPSALINWQMLPFDSYSKLLINFARTNTFENPCRLFFRHNPLNPRIIYFCLIVQCFQSFYFFFLNVISRKNFDLFFNISSRKFLALSVHIWFYKCDFDDMFMM